MAEDSEDFLDKLADILGEARAKMTPIEREFCDLRCNEIMECARNGFWICYSLRDPGRRLITKESLIESGREEEIKVLWLLEHGPFNFSPEPGSLN